MNQETSELIASIKATLKELQTIQEDYKRVAELKTLLLQWEAARVDFQRRAIV